MSTTGFKITREEIQHNDKSVTVFHLFGWVDAQSEEKIFSTAEVSYSQQGSRYLIINLEDVQMLTSAGIRVLQRIYRLYHSTETIGLKICSAPDQVYHALAITGFLQTVPMYENLQAALIAYDL